MGASGPVIEFIKPIFTGAALAIVGSAIARVRAAADNRLTMVLSFEVLRWN
jgi:hypothetical protein